MDPANVHVIGNGIEEFTPDWRRAAEFRARHGLDRQQFVVGLIAGFRPVKNHAMLLRAMRRLRDRIPATAVLVGDGPLRGEIVRMSHDLGIQDSVVLAGWVPDPKPIYACFDVLVSTSHSEGFSNSIGEAMMAGVPVVAADVSGNCDLIQSGFNGILVPPEDHEALADQLYLLATDAALRQRMSAAAQTWVRDSCSVARMVRRYEALYSALCASKGIYALEADAGAAAADSEV
jgi:glycosyltransferase involved in cell wall biosynthesis